LGFDLIKNKKIETNTFDDKFYLTDFIAYPNDNFNYGAGTGIYFPDGTNGFGYPFIGIYNKETLSIDTFKYFNIKYPGTEDTVQAVGLRVLYSSTSIRKSEN